MTWRWHCQIWFYHDELGVSSGTEVKRALTDSISRHSAKFSILRKRYPPFFFFFKHDIVLQLSLAKTHMLYLYVTMKIYFFLFDICIHIFISSTQLRQHCLYDSRIIIQFSGQTNPKIIFNWEFSLIVRQSSGHFRFFFFFHSTKLLMQVSHESRCIIRAPVMRLNFTQAVVNFPLLLT